MLPAIHQFGEFSYDPREARLLRHGRDLPLPPLGHRALCFLLERAGTLVSKEELMSTLWTDTCISEEVLTQAISKLRRALGDDAAEPRFIQTVPKRGYRFLVPPSSPDPEPGPGVQPPMAAYDPRWYVPRPTEEKRVRSYLAYPGRPAVLFAPQHFGKTWLLKHIVSQARCNPGRRVIELNLAQVDRSTRSSLDHFLRDLASRICRGCDVPDEWVQEAFVEGGSTLGMDTLVRRVLMQSPGELLLAIDSVDTLADSPVLDDFLGLLRGWADSADAEPLRHLRLILSVSTTPSNLGHPYQSPLNLVDPIEFSDLDQDQAEMLLRYHGLRWEQPQWSAVQTLLGGHPYLLRLLMEHCAQHGQPPEGALRPEGTLFNNYLHRLRSFLRRQDLEEVFAQLRLGPAVPPDSATFHRLHRAGLIVLEGDRCRLRHGIYQRL